MKEDTYANLTERQKLIGARTVCLEIAKTWQENFQNLNGNRQECLFNIDRRRHEKTLNKPKMLWEMIQENIKRSGKSLVISKMVLNTPGVWENNVPTLSRIAVRQKECAIFYGEIKSEEDLEKTISYLMMGATNKISLMLC